MRARQRWCGLLAAILTFATAAYFSYIAAFIYFPSERYRPDGPYGSRTCAQPHLVFGQICRDLTARGMTPWSRSWLGVAFLVVFLVIALAARRVVEVLLLFPLVTLPYVGTELHVWLVSAAVSVVAVVAITGLELLSGAVPPTRARWVPVGALVVGVTGSVVLSAFPLVWSPSVPVISVSAGRTADEVSTWPSIELVKVACTSATQCVAAGDRRQSENVVVEQDGAKGRSTTILGPADGPAYPVACARGGDCLSLGFGDNAKTLTLAGEDGGRWRSHRLSIARTGGLFGITAACSPGGVCWAIVHQLVPHTLWSYAVGLHDGRWLTPYRIGGAGLRVRGHPAAGVITSGITCWSASSCTVIGLAFAKHASASDAFLQTEVNGRWGPSLPLPTSLKSGFYPYLSLGESSALSCTSAGSCLVVGTFGSAGDGAVEQEIHGRWQAPVLLGLVGRKGSSSVLSVSCRSETFCIAAGSASSGSGSTGRTLPFVQVEVDGRWQPPSLMEDPGFAVTFPLVSGSECPTSSTCAIVGNFGTPGHTAGSFVARYDGSTWHWTIASVDGDWRSLWLGGLSCAEGQCWVTGTIRGPHNASTGVLAPLTES